MKRLFASEFWRAGILSLVLLAGCESRVSTRYGRVQDDSVNGTGVLASMFRQAGHHVSTWNELSPHLQKQADCIVWFPNNFQHPSQEVVEWLETWLRDQEGRTLIYVGRDFDAAPDYWRTIRPLVPATEQEAVDYYLDNDEQSYHDERSYQRKHPVSTWFSLKEQKPSEVKKLAGNQRWLEDLDVSHTNIKLWRRLKPALPAKILLKSAQDVLVSRVTKGLNGSQLILVANGSFLLNLPLVNREHRKLAGRLIEEIGSEKKNIVFLECWGDPPIRDEEPKAEMSTMFGLLLVWPTNWILMHLVAVAAVFCFSRWPIFGIARRNEDSHVSDFGKHVDALAEFLKRSENRTYAQTLIHQYRQGGLIKRRKDS